MFSCCSAPKPTKLWTGGLCFVAALLCFMAIVPVYVITYATPIDRFIGCTNCATDYFSDVVKTVNGSSIVDKIIHAHDHKSFHRGREQPDICITEDDLNNLDLDDVDIEPFPKECIDLCAPIAKKMPLAVACAGATCFAAIALLVCSLAALFSFCCCNPSEPPTYVMIDSAPSTSTSHVSIPHPPTGTATSYADAIKQPLMPNEH